MTSWILHRYYFLITGHLQRMPREHFCTFMTALLELQYLPPISYFAQLAYYSTIVIEQHEHYIKRSYRNRCHIAGANGVLRLSIPLEKGKNAGLNIRRVRIAYHDNWQQQHWQSLQSAYGNAPFFEYYADELYPIYQQPYELLWDWNWALLQLVLSWLPISPTILLSDKYLKEPSLDVIDLRNQIRPQHRPIATDASLPPSLRRAIPSYPQVFQEKTGFLANLSILDLLFCQGPAAVTFLTLHQR